MGMSIDRDFEGFEEVVARLRYVSELAGLAVARLYQ